MSSSTETTPYKVTRAMVRDAALRDNVDEGMRRIVDALGIEAEFAGKVLEEVQATIDHEYWQMAMNQRDRELLIYRWLEHRGVKAGHNVDVITDDMIAAAAQNPDLDAALVPLMDAAGISDGGLASVHFSGVTDNDDESENWAALDPATREGLIREWLPFERTEDEDGEA